MQNSNETILDGLTAATYYKYFAQDNNSRIVKKMPFERISAKTFYAKNKYVFDKAVETYQKYIIDYFKFLIYECKKTEFDAQEVVLSKVYFSKFVDYLKVNSQYSKIYKWFLKSVNNIVNDCIKLGFTSTKEYMQYLILNRLLVAKYLSGEISIYYLSAIQNFKKIIPKLDNISQAEFSKILNRYDKYNLDIQETFKKYKSCRINPIQFTDKLLWKKLNNKM